MPGPIAAVAAPLVRAGAGVAPRVRVLGFGARARPAGARMLPSAMGKNRARPETWEEHRAKTASHDEKPTAFMDRVSAAHSLMEELLSTTDKIAPFGGHSIIVTAVGGPLADLRRVWYLAVSAAFGRYRYRIGTTAGESFQMMAVWDVTHKACTIEVVYKVSGALQLVEEFTSGPVTEDSVSWLIPGVREPAKGKVLNLRRPTGAQGIADLMHEGPDQVTIGASWPLIANPNNSDSIGDYKQQEVRPWPVLDDRQLVSRYSGPRKVNPLGELRYKLTTSDLKATLYGRFLSIAGLTPENKTVVLLPHGQVQDVRSLLGIPNGPVMEAYPTNPTSDRAVGELQRTSFSVGGETLPLLPDNNRIITTGEKRSPLIQPPKPVVDGISRSSLVDMFTAALHDPCKAFRVQRDTAFFGNGHYKMRLSSAMFNLGRWEDWLAESVALAKLPEHTNATAEGIKKLSEEASRLSYFNDEQVPKLGAQN